MIVGYLIVVLMETKQAIMRNVEESLKKKIELGKGETFGTLGGSRLPG